MSFYCLSKLFDFLVIKNASWLEKWEKELLKYIENEEVEQFLPDEVVIRLLKNPVCEEKMKTNVIVKRFFFLQCLFGNMMPLDRNNKIHKELRIVNLFRWVSSDFGYLLSPTNDPMG